MDSPRSTFALGPFEISLKRREQGVRLGVIGSLAMHLLIVTLLTVAVPHRNRALAPEAIPPTQPRIPVTFVDPLPPQPRPPADTFTAKPPPRTSVTKPLRMEPVPETLASSQTQQKDQRRDAAGRRDREPQGGEAGGPKPETTAGTPERTEDAGPSGAASDELASRIDEPKDIFGRLREFKRAVEAPRPSTSSGPEGGGRGSGGVTMPDLPATGFGVGNLEFEGRDYDWENYGRQIHGIIWRAWHNRLLITSSVFERWATEHRSWMLDHRNGVRFTILRTGQVVDVAIETPSGCYPLDDSATDALKEVVLPPLPADFQRDRETVHARFIAQGEIRTMKAFLQQMKNAGYF